MKVLVERHNHEAEYSHRFKCVRCGSELEFTSNDIIRGCIIPTYWDMRTWRLNVLGVQCPICNKWYYIDKNCSIVPANGDFEREYW